MRRVWLPAEGADGWVGREASTKVGFKVAFFEVRRVWEKVGFLQEAHVYAAVGAHIEEDMPASG